MPGDVIGLASAREMLRFEYADDVRPVPTLTNREMEVLILLSKGKLNKEIATELCISPTTVNTYLKRIFEKFGAHNRTEAVNAARSHRLI